MKNRDRVEYYDKKNGGLIVAVGSSIVPAVGSFISIRKEVWVVDAVTLAIDHSDDDKQKAMRCNVDLRKTSFKD